MWRPFEKVNDMKGIVFDLDGVICSTDHYHYLAWKALADKLNIYFDETINNRLRGVSRMESLEIILERSEKCYSQQEKESFAAEKNEVYKQLLVQMNASDLADEVKTTLDTLRQRGYKLAIGSSSKNTKLILSRLGLENYFYAIADGTDITYSKPHPEVFLLAAKRLGFTPNECLVVEDAKAGIEAATRGGFRSAGIGEAAEQKSVTYPIAHFADLLDIVK